MPAIDSEGLRRAFSLAGISQTQLADRLGISLTYCGDLLAGRRTAQRNPGLRHRLAAELGVPTHWIERRDEQAAS